MGIIIDILSFVSGMDKFVLVPFVVFILAVLFGVKVKDALKSALMFGAGLLGIITITNVMYEYMGNVAVGLISNAGINNTVLDIGMGGLFGAVVSLPFFIFLYPIGILLNIFLIWIKWTKTFDIDFLTYFGFLLPGIPIYMVTGNYIPVLIGFVIYLAVCLKIADWTAPMVQEYYEVEGVSIPHNSCGFQAVLVIPLNWIIDHIPVIKDIDINIGTMKNKLGIFGDPAVISFLVGFVLSLLAGLGISPSLSVGMALVFTCYLYPKAIGIMMEGLTPISKHMRDWGQKKLNRDDIYVGMDASIFAGYPEVVAVSSLYIPIMLLLFFFLPGSTILPTGDSFQLAIVIGMILPFAGSKGKKGNIFRTLLIATVLGVIAVYAEVYVAESVTAIATKTGFDLAGMSLVTSGGMRDLPTVFGVWLSHLFK